MKQIRLKTLQLLFGVSFIFGFVLYLGLSVFLIHLADVQFGMFGRVMVGVLALVGFFMVFLRYLYRFGDFVERRDRDEAREKYRFIYRVIALPGDDKPNNWQAHLVEIGDYGWESKPPTQNGLIYLHGLTEDWGWVWRAGFRPDQLELVGPKPVSQYDWRDFEYDGPKPTACYHRQYNRPKNPCPFPIQKKVNDIRLQFPI